MVTLRRIGVVSAGRVGFWVGVAVMLTIIMLSLLLAATFGNLPLRSLGLDFLIRVAFSLMMSGIQFAFLFGMLAFIYNRAASVGGGIELDFDMPGATGSKRKNGETDDESDKPDIV